MMDAPLPFADRREAGRLLAARLAHLADTDPLVLALPRGGVPVAGEIARALGAELDVMMVRKLGAPGNPEFAIGAVVDGDDPQLVVNDEAINLIKPGDAYLEREKRAQLAELERRRKAYVGERHKPRIAGRTVIIVDDGIATGATITAAIKGARQAGAGRLVLAVPVAPRETAWQLHRLYDELVVLAQPEPFLSVGQHYRDFAQTSDAEVIRLLASGQDKAG
ncbi:MAG: phosphoribosyltransferase [Erythrobacteraceae bacterium]|jgi:putative phosphoribosyl transferase|nr:phosphoribosyltransferase [Erythrobacteraceae bacterium]